MIVYHGTPFGGDRAGVARFLKNRHALIPFLRNEDCAVAFEECQTVIFDNSAFTAWKQGESIQDWNPYYEWVRQWFRHPSFGWAIIPDVIDGTEEQNDDLIEQWPDDLKDIGAPVWHMHESLSRLERLTKTHSRICLGSSGEFAQLVTPKWWGRIIEAMDVCCDENGGPLAKLHGLRMADKEIVCRIPFSSVDSTNVAQNSSLIGRFGSYAAPTRWQRAEAIAARMEYMEVAPFWDRGVWARETGEGLFAGIEVL